MPRLTQRVSTGSRTYVTQEARWDSREFLAAILVPVPTSSAIWTCDAARCRVQVLAGDPSFVLTLSVVPAGGPDPVGVSITAAPLP